MRFHEHGITVSSGAHAVNLRVECANVLVQYSNVLYV